MKWFIWPDGAKAGSKNIVTLASCCALFLHAGAALRAAALDDQGFENGLGAWTVEGGLWEVGIPTAPADQDPRFSYHASAITTGTPWALLTSASCKSARLTAPGRM